MSRLNNTSASYGMEISVEKTKLMTNNSSGINKKITMNGQRLETVSKFNYLYSVITDEGSKPEIISRISQTTAAMTRLKPIWKDTKHHPSIQNQSDAITCNCNVNISIYMRDMDTYSRTTNKSTSHGNEVLSKDPLHLIQGPCNQRRDPQQNQTSSRAL